MASQENYTEAEIQLLIALIELAEPISTPNNNHYIFFPKTMEEAACYFRGLHQDLTSAYASLTKKGAIVNPPHPPLLTPAGRQLAVDLRAARPPIYYWYQESNKTTQTSTAYADFCERLFGKNLCQYCFSDMDQLNQMLSVLHLNPSSKVLDLGCAKGMIAEYFSDTTGAQFTGIDYSEEAVAQALERTQSKRSRLDFQIQNMDDLKFPEACFDAVISIDTLYMPNDLTKTLRKVVEMLKPGGQILAFYTQMIDPGHGNRDELLPANTPLGVSLREIGLPFTTTDFSPANTIHLQKKHLLGQQMKAAFEKEGSLALWENIMAESESSLAPYDPGHASITRYLYRICPE